MPRCCAPLRCALCSSRIRALIRGLCMYVCVVDAFYDVCVCGPYGWLRRTWTLGRGTRSGEGEGARRCCARRVVYPSIHPSITPDLLFLLLLLLLLLLLHLQPVLYTKTRHPHTQPGTSTTTSPSAPPTLPPYPYLTANPMKQATRTFPLPFSAATPYCTGSQRSSPPASQPAVSSLSAPQSGVRARGAMGTLWHRAARQTDGLYVARPPPSSMEHDMDIVRR